MCEMLLPWAGTLHQSPEGGVGSEGPSQVFPSLKTGGKRRTEWGWDPGNQGQEYSLVVVGIMVP